MPAVYNHLSVLSVFFLFFCKLGAVQVPCICSHATMRVTVDDCFSRVTHVTAFKRLLSPFFCLVVVVVVVVPSDSVCMFSLSA